MYKIMAMNETISLMALGSGIWEYFKIGDMEDLKEAYNDFDNRVAFGGDIELQYIDGNLYGYSCTCFEEVLEMSENNNYSIEDIINVLNATESINETERILEQSTLMYVKEVNEIEAFREYLFMTDFFGDIAESKHHFIDIEKVKRDYYNIDIYKTNKQDEYMIIID